MNDNNNDSKALVRKDKGQLTAFNRTIEISERALLPARRAEVMAFCIKHPEFFFKIASKYFPFSEALISKVKHLIDWSLISKNINIKWTSELIGRYSGKLNWDNLSGNGYIPWEIEMLRKFQGRLQWEFFYCKNQIAFSLENIEEFESYLFCKPNVNYLSPAIYNHKIQIPWSFSLIEKYLDMWEWDKLSDVQELPWSIELIDRYIDKWDWYKLSNNQGLPWSIGLIERYADRFIFKHHPSFSTSSLNSLSSNCALPWSIELIDKFEIKWDWSKLSINKALPWNEELIQKYSEKWHWENLSCNDAIKWDAELIRKYAAKIDFTGISRNKNVLWSEELISEFHNLWNWDRLSGNSGLPWSEELVDKYEMLLNWQGEKIEFDFWPMWNYCLSYNSQLPWSYEFIQKHKNKINWSALSINHGVNWSIRLLKEYWEKYNVNSLIQWNSVWKKAFEKYVDEGFINELIESIEHPIKNDIDPSLSLDQLKVLLGKTGILSQAHYRIDYNKIIALCGIIYEKYGNIELKITKKLNCVIACQGDAYYYLKDYSNAVLKYNWLIENGQNAYLLDRSRCYRNIGDINSAFEDATEVITADQFSYLGYLERGRIYKIKHEYEKAINDFTTALNIKAKLRINDTVYKLSIRRGEKAPADFIRKIILNERADVYDKIGLPTKAIEDYSMILEEDPEDYEAYENRIRLFKELEQDENAIEDLSNYIKMRPDDTSLYSNRAELFIKTDKYEQAIEDYSTIIAKEPEFINWYYYCARAKALFAIGLWNKSLADLNKLYVNIDNLEDKNEKDEAKHDMLFLYAAIYLLEGKEARNSEVFNKLIDSDGFLEKLEYLKKQNVEDGSKTTIRARYDLIPIY